MATVTPINDVERYTEGMSVDRVDDSKLWRFRRKLGYRVIGLDVCAQAGTTTDFSSTPGVYDAFVDHSKVDYAGGIHDALYRTGALCNGTRISRRKADKIWRKVAQHGEWSANWAQAWLGWAGLRVGGWIPWGRYRGRR